MNTTILTITIALMATNIVYTEYANLQDEIAKSQMLYEAQATISTKNSTMVYSYIEKDKNSLSEITFSEWHIHLHILFSFFCCRLFAKTQILFYIHKEKAKKRFFICYVLVSRNTIWFLRSLSVHTSLFLRYTFAHPIVLLRFHSEGIAFS